MLPSTCGSRPGGRPTDLSIPDRRRQAKGYCTSRGWEIVVDYVEPGASAIDDRPPEFQRMIDAATTKPSSFEVSAPRSMKMGTILFARGRAG